MTEPNLSQPSGGTSPSYNTPPVPSSTPLLDAIIDNTPTKRLEYLRGKEGAITSLAQWGFIGAVIVFLGMNIDLINHTLDGFISGLAKLGVIGGALAAIWLICKVIGSKAVRDGVNYGIDKAIFKIARWLRTRGDKILNARFNIDRLKKRKAEADMALAKVNGVYAKFDNAATSSKKETQAAYAKVQAFDEEMQRRKRGGREQPNFSDLAALPADQLERYRNRAAIEMRVSNDAFKDQAAERDKLKVNCAFLKDLSDGLDSKVGELEFKLNKAIEKNELSKDKAAAMAAYAEVSGGQEVEDFNQTMGDIEKETEFYNGYAQVLMDHLDPTVQKQRMDKVTDVVTADQLYREFSAKIGGMRPEVAQELLTPTQPVIPEVERYLGNPVSAPTPRSVKYAPPQSKPGSIDDDLLS